MMSAARAKFPTRFVRGRRPRRLAIDVVRVVPGHDLGRDRRAAREEPYIKLRLSDESRTASGRETLADVVGTEPTIVIIDEIAQHLRQLTSSGNPDVRRQAEAIPVFLKKLFELAAARPNVVVIITLATRSDAFGKETDELSDALEAAAASDARDAFRETQSIVARPTSGGSIVTPAADDEIGEILKRRLFASIGPAAAQEAGEASVAFPELRRLVDHRLLRLHRPRREHPHAALQLGS